MTYYVIEHQGAASVFFVETDGRRSFIPEDPANTDYQEYLEWLAEGNTPEPWPPAE